MRARVHEREEEAKGGRIWRGRGRKKMNTIFLVEIYSFIEMDRWMQSEIITLLKVEEKSFLDQRLSPSRLHLLLTIFTSNLDQGKDYI